MRQEFGFARTVCGCPQCSINCRFIPGHLLPDDLIRLAARLGYERVLDFGMDNLLASPGAVVGNAAGGRRLQVS